MKILKLTMILIAILLFSVGISSAELASDCSYLQIDNSVYKLWQNVSSTGTCFEINGRNITLDCGGAFIRYGSIWEYKNNKWYPSFTESYGILVRNSRNINIKNCLIDSRYSEYEPIKIINSTNVKQINVKIDESYFVRGDANQDGIPNSKDANFIIDYLFNGGPAPKCIDSADWNDDGEIDLSDAIGMLSYCRNGCGGGFALDYDKTPDRLWCESYR